MSEDLYLRGFVSDLYLRPSCYRCSFKQIKRQSDFTIADFWGVEKSCNFNNDDTGISLVLLHNEKAFKLIKNLEEEITVFEVDYKKAIAENKSYCVSVSHSIYRKAFYKKLNKKSVDKAIKCYYGKGVLSKVRRLYHKYLDVF